MWCVCARLCVVCAAWRESCLSVWVGVFPQTGCYCPAIHKTYTSRPYPSAPFSSPPIANVLHTSTPFQNTQPRRKATSFNQLTSFNIRISTCLLKSVNPQSMLLLSQPQLKSNPLLST